MSSEHSIRNFRVVAGGSLVFRHHSRVQNFQPHSQGISEIIKDRNNENRVDTGQEMVRGQLKCFKVREKSGKFQK